MSGAVFKLSSRVGGLYDPSPAPIPSRSSDLLLSGQRANNAQLTRLGTHQLDARDRCVAHPTSHRVRRNTCPRTCPSVKGPFPKDILAASAASPMPSPESHLPFWPRRRSTRTSLTLRSQHPIQRQAPPLAPHQAQPLDVERGSGTACTCYLDHICRYDVVVADTSVVSVHP